MPSYSLNHYSSNVSYTSPFPFFAESYQYFYRSWHLFQRTRAFSSAASLALADYPNRCHFIGRSKLTFRYTLLKHRFTHLNQTCYQLNSILGLGRHSILQNTESNFSKNSIFDLFLILSFIYLFPLLIFIKVSI